MNDGNFRDKEKLMEDIELDGFVLKMTCISCPEQYDVFRDGKKVAYLRLRHGTFRADVPDCGGETVHVSKTEGDGCFYEDERIPELRKALEAVRKNIDSGS